MRVVLLDIPPPALLCCAPHECLRNYRARFCLTQPQATESAVSSCRPCCARLQTALSGQSLPCCVEPPACEPCESPRASLHLTEPPPPLQDAAQTRTYREPPPQPRRPSPSTPETPSLARPSESAALRQTECSSSRPHHHGSPCPSSASRFSPGWPCLSLNPPHFTRLRCYVTRTRLLRSSAAHVSSQASTARPASATPVRSSIREKKMIR